MALLLVVAVACGSDGVDDAVPTPAGQDQAAAVESDVVLGTRVSDGAPLTMTIRYPTDPSDAPIVFSGFQDLTDEGVIVVDIGDDEHLGEGKGLEGSLADPSAMRDLADRHTCALHLVRARAAEHGNNDPVVVLTGLSWGAGLATHVGLFGDTLQERWDEFAANEGPARQWDCTVPDGTTHVDAVVGTAGAYGPWVPIYDADVPEGSGGYGLTYQTERHPELQRFLASAVGANPDLQVRLIHGTYDGGIPIVTAVGFEQALADAGYDVELTPFDGGHEGNPELQLQAIRDAITQ